MNSRQIRLARCGDRYGYGLWLQDNVYYKNEPPHVGAKAYAAWLRYQPLCGHKQCAGKRAQRLAALEGKV